jgi:beta-galactosidase
MSIHRNRLSIAAALLIAAVGARAHAADPLRVESLFDDNWKFSGMQAADIAGAETAAFSDAQWRTLNVPHDWSIEQKPDTANKSGPAGAYLPGGIGYYRKTFPTPAGSAGKRVFLQFDGVMQDSTVWLNGEKIGGRPYGYSSFRIDLTGKLKDTGDNVLAVRANCTPEPIARWYTGAGIYRHVRLIVTNPIHVEQWATHITTPKADASGATVHLETSVFNGASANGNVGIEIDLLGPDGKVAQSAKVAPKPIATGKAEPFAVDITVANPQLWDVNTPHLYKAVVRVVADGTPVDEDVNTFGIRTFEFKPDTGFWLNGKNLKMYGVCLHHDGGGFGAAVPNGIWERRFKELKEIGVNAIRTSHNIPDIEFLNLCDRMGMLVMEDPFDVWESRKTPGDYARFFKEWWERDLTDMLMRDRNHPSIVIHCAGNEIRDSEPNQMRILADLIKVYHKVDPTRPVTQALFRPVDSAYVNGHAAMLDVVGTNYRPRELVAYQKAHPEAKIIGTEDNYGEPELITLRDSPALAGEFLWTGWDYLGEGRTPPSIAQGFGMTDRTGEWRLRAYERQSWWIPAETKSMVKIGRVQPTGRNQNDTGGNRVIDWTPANLEAHQESVDIWSNCEEVELFLNDKSLGSKTRPANWSARNWKVDFAPGTLKAVAKHKGQVVATDELRTASKATKVKLTVDQPTLSPAWDEVAYVRAELVDDNGVRNPNAADKVTFKIDGPGIIAAIDNADLDSHELFRGNERSAFRGSCIAILKATGTSGKITLTASAEGLTPATVTLEAAAPK